MKKELDDKFKSIFKHNSSDDEKKCKNNFYVKYLISNKPQVLKDLDFDSYAEHLSNVKK